MAKLDHYTTESPPCHGFQTQARGEKSRNLGIFCFFVVPNIWDDKKTKHTNVFSKSRYYVNPLRQPSLIFQRLERTPFEKYPAYCHLLRRNSWISFSLWNLISFYFHQKSISFALKFGVDLGYVWRVLAQIFHSGEFLVIDYFW